jgi:hypothetical protein
MPRYIVDFIRTRTWELDADNEEALGVMIAESGYGNDGWEVAEITEVPEWHLMNDKN